MGFKKFWGFGELLGFQGGLGLWGALWASRGFRALGGSFGLQEVWGFGGLFGLQGGLGFRV